MAVRLPGENAQLTASTATWPPKRMVRSRVSSIRADLAGISSLPPCGGGIGRGVNFNLASRCTSLPSRAHSARDDLPYQGGGVWSKPIRMRFQLPARHHRLLRIGTG